MASREKGATGTWTGRLVDVQGVEGDLVLRLKTRRDAVSGAFRIEVGGNHETLADEGRVTGGIDGDRVKLELAGRKQAEVVLEAHLVELSEGGRGMCGTYRVSARRFSPLAGGALALGADLPAATVEMKAEVRG